MKTTALALSLILALLFSAVAGVGFVNLAFSAVAVPPIWLPSITIRSEGSIDPTGMPITRTGNVYTLTGNISGYSLDIQCSNITVDGAGYALQTEMMSLNAGIIIEANGVTVKNIRIYGNYYMGINVNSSSNTITKNSISTMMGTGINLPSDYNNITGNTLDNYGGGIAMTGKYNNIIGNIIRKRGPGIQLEMDFARFNSIVGNTLSPTGGSSGLTMYAKPRNNGSILAGYNAFYLNNFARSKWSNPVTLGGGANSSAAYAMNIFDNGSVGNYWNDYNGTDADHDGIGDTPYVIGERIADRYPLMTPFDINNSTIVVVPLPIVSPTEPFVPFPTVSTTEPFPTTFVAAASVASLAVIGVGLLIYFKKYRH